MVDRNGVEIKVGDTVLHIRVNIIGTVLEWDFKLYYKPSRVQVLLDGGGRIGWYPIDVLVLSDEQHMLWKLENA